MSVQTPRDHRVTQRDTQTLGDFRRFPFQQFLTNHGDVSRGIGPDLDLITPHFEDGDDDVIGDAEGFADTAGEDQHVCSPCAVLIITDAPQAHSVSHHRA